MGHLINPVAFRLGYMRSWEDSWFVKNIYYPEFLHSILKIRNYIYYFWTTRYMEKKGFLLSHLYIYKFIKNLLIKIFLYNTDIEKNTYSFYAKGFSIFSDSMYYRFKKKKKRKKFFFYERYKPDFFFTIFLYSYFFLKKNMNIKKRKKIKGFKYYHNIKKKKKNNKEYKVTNKIFKLYNQLKYNKKNEFYLNQLKKGNLNLFFKSPIKNNIDHLCIPKYEDDIKQVLGKFNMGFFDFIMYVFFKINWWEKDADDMLRLKTKKRNLEMILNYQIKIKRLIYLLKTYTKLRIRLSKNENKSIKNFIFFLVFLIELLLKIKKNRIKYKLRDLNLKLVRLLFFNKILVDLGFFFGDFLRHILYLLTNIRKYSFRFCFLSNSSLNAKFLARYISLKLKRKFPLFYVINPIKKELRKLFFKKKEKKFSVFVNLINLKQKKKLINEIYDYKKGFKDILLYLYKKYVELYALYYKKQKTLITFDYYIYFLILRNKYNNQMLLKKRIFHYFLEKKWKKRVNKKEKYMYLNNKWVLFLKNYISIGYNVLKILFYKQIIFLSKLHLFIKNKLLISLFFGNEKYNVDALAYIFFNLKFKKNTFFYINTKFINLFMYLSFNNFIFFNFNTILYMDNKYLMISNYFFKSFMYYNYTLYSFNNFFNYFKTNKKKNYYKIKEISKTRSFIMGFKMSFKGRFSRKQRASSIWFHQGYVPLNTIKAIIDYAFFTVPLKNSAISVKLWLYKNVEVMHWHYKFYNDIKISIN